MHGAACGSGRSAGFTLPLCLHLAAGLPLLALLPGPRAHAQAVAGNDQHTAIAQSMPEAGGRSTTPTWQLESTVAQPATGSSSTDGTLSLVSSVAWTTPVLASARPLVHAVYEKTGLSVGGDSVTLHGLNFAAPGAGAADVTFGGSFGASTMVVSNTEITTTTPPGMDVFGNPLAAVGIEVSNNLGSDSAAAPFVYLPALRAHGPSQLGKEFEIRMLGEPMSCFFLFYGGNGMAMNFSLPGVLGMSALRNDPVDYGPPIFTTTGQAQAVFQVPDMPQLVGKLVEFQAIALTDVMVLDGSFTNVLDTTIQP